MKERVEDCRAMEDLLPVHAVEETSVEEGLRVEQHVEGCPECREALGFYRTIRDTARESLRAVPAPPSPEKIGPSAGARLWIPRLAAAAVLLVAGIAAGRWSAQSVPAPSAPAGTGATVASARAPEGEISDAPRRPVMSVFSPAVRDRLVRAAQVARREGSTR